MSVAARILVLATAASTVEHLDRGPLALDELAEVIARDIPDGSFVNLGFGLPTKIADYLRNDKEVVLHAENGMLGMGRAADGEVADADLTNAGKCTSPS